MINYDYVKKVDPIIADVLDQELQRQRGCVELIASENFVSEAVLQVAGSVLTNKYAEGYPSKRYYGGCEKVDLAENIAIKRACELFKCNFANVQPHCGSTANYAAYQSVAPLGSTIMGMSLDQGGHLTHGSKVNFSGKNYNFISYGLNIETERIDYDEMLKLAKMHRPKIIVGGASAYPRSIDFARMRKIADEVGAYLMVDMAHIAGLVATGAHISPIPYADIVTTTTHKTLRGPRGGMILWNNETLTKKINSSLFPGSQGGPLMHIIAAKAVAFKEALQADFKVYIDNVVKNCKAMGEGAVQEGLRLVTGGTDNHLCLVDLTNANITGAEAETLLEKVGLTVNKNAIPNDPLPPTQDSGIRLGSAAGTTRGITEEEFRTIGQLIAISVKNKNNELLLAEVRSKVNDILTLHPIYADIC